MKIDGMIVLRECPVFLEFIFRPEVDHSFDVDPTNDVHVGGGQPIEAISPVDEVALDECPISSSITPDITKIMDGFKGDVASYFIHRTA
jgi:hypothetical protein